MTEPIRHKLGTVHELYELLHTELQAHNDFPIQLEVSSLQGNVQTSIRQYLDEVVITPKKIILKAHDPEGWRTE